MPETPEEKPTPKSRGPQMTMEDRAKRALEFFEAATEEDMVPWMWLGRDRVIVALREGVVGPIAMNTLEFHCWTLRRAIYRDIEAQEQAKAPKNQPRFCRN